MHNELAILEKRRRVLETSLAIAKKARDEADGRMQSRYDTQKEDAAQEVAMYEALLDNVNKLMTELSELENSPATNTVTVGRHVVIEFEEGNREEFLLLDSQGGVNLGEYQTMSTDSPVGGAILDAHVGETVRVQLAQGLIVVKIVAVE